MLISRQTIFAIFVIVAIGCQSRHANESSTVNVADPMDESADGYITKSGMLTSRLEIREHLYGRSFGNGSFCTIEPNGRWSVGGIKDHQELTETSSGELSTQEINRLSEILKRGELLTTSVNLNGKKDLNPVSLSIVFGTAHWSVSLPLELEIDQNLELHEKFNTTLQAIRELISTNRDKK